jgi:anti-sigma-K factor RskA
VDDETLHELTPAYVLDALDAPDLESFEEHLATCARCREEVAELSGAAAALAYGVPPVAPPPALRARILEAARAERPNVVPMRPRWAVPVAAAAAIAACVAIGLGVWDVSLHDQLGGAHDQTLLRVPLARGASGSVVVASGGSGALVLSNLVAAPGGKTYEAWVIRGRAVSPAGLFHGGGATTIVALSRPVPAGAVVAVTVEPAGGSAAPTGKALIVSRQV